MNYNASLHHSGHINSNLQWSCCLMITDFTLFFTWALRLWQQPHPWTWQTINAPLLKPTLLISLQKVPFCCSIDSKVAALAKEPPLFFKCRWLREDHLSWPPYRLCTFCTGRWWRRLIDGLGEHFQAVPKNWCRKSPSCFPSPCWSGCTDRHSRLQGDGSIFCSSHL